MQFAGPQPGDADWQEWLDSTDAAERARVRELLAALQEIARARHWKRGAAAAALKRHHLGWGWSERMLLKNFTAFRCGGHKPGDHRKLGPTYPAGDWRILVRAYKAGQEGALPEETKRWLAEQFLQFRGRNDCVHALWRHVVYELWLKDAPVPGFGTCTEWCRTAGRARPHPQLVRPGELPEGFTVATFRRALPARMVTRASVQHGYLEAHRSQPDQVLTDRSPLLPLQYVFLDDSRPDFRCTWFGPGGRGELVYPLLVMGLDADSGVDLEAVTKPRALKTEDGEQKTENGGKRHGVTQDMALRVVVGVLRRHGLMPWPICFVHERAAACVPSEAKHLLHGVYGDRIQFMETGIFCEKMLGHGFTDQGGAPYDKAPIEAFWRILMTQLARLPGSTGPRYDTAPGELAQIEKYTLGLVEKAGHVHDVFRMFQSPMLDWAEADAAIMAALRLLRFRTQHKLQGFEKVREWRPSPAEGYRPWSEFLTLSQAEQDRIGTSDDKYALIHRLESPAERFCRKLQGVERTVVDDDLLVFLEGPRQPVRVRDGKIVVRDTARFGGDDLVFREEHHPLLEEDYEGKQLEAAIAGDGSRIVLTEEGRILGSVFAQGRVVRGSEECRREMGRVRAARVADREHLRGYLLADTDAALAEMKARNAEVAASPALQAARAGALEEKRAPRAKKPSAATAKNNARRALQMAQRAEGTVANQP